MSEAPLLKVERLTMKFGNLLANDDVSFEVGKGQIVALIGPNGGRKDHVLQLPVRLLRPVCRQSDLRRA